MVAALPPSDPATGRAWWDVRGWGPALAAATPSGRARVPVSWALYDFANTIFSYAVVSFAFGLWLTDPQRLGQAQGQLWQSIAILSSVGLNALVSPILGAVSDRGGRRLPYLLVFTVLCIVPSAFIGAGSAALGIVLFVLANFGYQAALIYYDATLKTVSRPAARGGLSGFGVSIGYLGTIFIALLLLVLPLPLEGAFPLQAILFAIFAVPIFLVVREQATPGYHFRVADVAASWRQMARTIDDTRAVPGLGRFLLGPLLLLGCRQHGHRGHERLRRAGHRPDRQAGQPGAPAADDRGRPGQPGLGAAGGPHRAQAHAARRARLMGRRPGPGGGVALHAHVRHERGRLPRGGGHPGQRPGRRPGGRPRADDPALTARPAGRVLRPVRPRRQGLAGRGPAALRARRGDLPGDPRQRRLPAGHRHPVRHDAHRPLAGVAGERPTGPGRTRRLAPPVAQPSEPITAS